MNWDANVLCKLDSAADTPDHIASDEDDVGEEGVTGADISCCEEEDERPGEPERDDDEDDKEGCILTLILPSSVGEVSNEISRSPRLPSSEASSSEAVVNSSCFRLL